MKLQYPPYPQDNRILLTPEIPEEKILEWKKDLDRVKIGYHRDSLNHFAKMHIKLAQWIILKFTKEKEVILDPMAGIGTVGVEASKLGRHCLMVEYESKFAECARKNIELINHTLPLFAKGKADIIHGDARNLSKILLDAKNKCPFYGKIDAIITSPPYSNINKEKRNKEQFIEKLARVLEKHAVLFKWQCGKSWHTPGRLQSMKTLCSGYPENKDNIGNLPYGEMDEVVIPPLYSKGTMHLQEEKLEGKLDGEDGFFTNENERDINNLRHERINKLAKILKKTYLSEMLKVYLECYKVLKANGLMILIVKNLIKKRKIFRLDFDTILLAERSGFILKDRYFRRITRPSLWTASYRKRFPSAERVDYEDVLIFCKL